MTDRRIMVLPVALIEKIDANRGDIDRSEFLDLLIESHLQRESGGQPEKRTGGEGFVTQESLEEFERGIKELLRNFLEFLVSYGLELGPRREDGDLEALSKKLKN